MSIFASRTRKVLTMESDDDRQPDGSPHTITIQKLSGLQMEEAAAVASRTSMANAMASYQSLGGIDIKKALDEIGDITAAVAEAQRLNADPTSGLDTDMALRCGVVEWTYDLPLTPVEIVNKDGTKTIRIPALDDLDKERRDFISGEITQLSKRGHTREAQKNGSSPSIEA